MRLLYFAWVRQHVGQAEEELTPPPEVTTVGTLMGWLAGRSAGHAKAFAQPKQLRAAVNQEFARAEDHVHPGDEVAFFPPVTGG